MIGNNQNQKLQALITLKTKIICYHLRERLDNNRL